LALALFTLTFLLASIWLGAEAKVKPWKFSSVVLLFHDFSEERVEAGRTVNGMAEMIDKAKGMRMELVKMDDRWIFR